MVLVIMVHHVGGRSVDLPLRCGSRAKTNHQGIHSVDAAPSKLSVRASPTTLD